MQICSVMFEPTSVPQTEWAERAAALSDVVKVSQQPGEGLSSWTPTRGASTRFIIETLGSRGARVRSRSRRGWSAWQQVPAVATVQSPVLDTAGAGDWLTAGLIITLLQEEKSVAFDRMRTSILYGQRLSAISISFEGPHGALMSLGVPMIERIARGTSPIRVPSQL